MSGFVCGACRRFWTYLSSRSCSTRSTCKSGRTDAVVGWCSDTSILSALRDSSFCALYNILAYVEIENHACESHRLRDAPLPRSVVHRTLTGRPLAPTVSTHTQIGLCGAVSRWSGSERPFGL